MVALNYRLSEHLESTTSSEEDNYSQPPAANSMRHGKLDIGPAVLVASALSLLCWGAIIGGIYLLIH